MSMSDVGARADFSIIRYAQCWEDADVLLEALGVGPGDQVLSIASAGDNSFSLLSKGPERVVAVDLSVAQLACVALRAAAYRELEHGELLELVGSRPSKRRPEYYRRCRPLLSSEARGFWDAHSGEIEAGIGAAGKFERYFALFRLRVLPLVHSKKRVHALFEPRDEKARQDFYHGSWENRRWRWVFKLFFSRFVMGRFGRDQAFFDYVEGSVADRIFGRARYAMTTLDPSENPYLQWIMLGTHGTALPHALRAENFDAIRSNLDRLEVRASSLEEIVRSSSAGEYTAFNLSDMFEYLADEQYYGLLEAICNASKPGARLAYWNMLVPRSRPPEMADKMKPLTDLAQRLHERDKAFFYSRFVVEEVAA